MDLIVDKLQSNAENEEEDYESYFLQPASSPYNIAEKVQQANIDLFSNNLTMEKTSRVTFKEELTSYEPELLLTDDDVNSIESDPPENEVIPEGNQILEYKSTNVINLNIFDINEDDEVEVEEEEDDDDNEVIEEIIPEECEEIRINKIVDNKLQSCDVFNDDDEDNPSEKTDNTVTVKVSSSKERKDKPSNKRKKSRKKSPTFKPLKTPGNTVECKNHCIERLDFDLSMSVRKLEIYEKPVKCPLLKLQRRKCCDENRARNPTNLPCYNGHRSEYGLSSADLEKRERRKEIIKLKEEKRQQLMQEYKNRKNQQNEAVFCQWLKDVAKRKAQKTKNDNSPNSNTGKQSISPNVISFPAKVNEKLKERPKTANEFITRQNIKRARRPHTSPACVFIEVPQKILEQGIHIGDLLVTNSNLTSKKMHILTVSS